MPAARSKIAASLILSALALALVTGCSRVDRAVFFAQAGHLRVGFHLEPHSLSPILAQHLEEFAIVRLFSDVLTSYDDRGRLVPMLAAVVPTRENAGISPDERTITYRLRHNVRWHDGLPFTSADVAFTWRAIMNPENDVVSHDGYDLVDRVETPDPFTVRFHLKRRFAPIVGQLFGDDDSPYGMLPAHLLAKYPSLNHVAFNAAPIGTGPFIFKRWLRGDRIEFVANPAYFLGKPGLSRITVSFASDENALVARLRAHEVDWLNEVSPTTLPLLRTIPGVRTVTVAKNEWFGIGFQMRRHAGRDLHLRRAIAAAIDKTRLVANLTFGTAQPASVDLPAFSWGHPRDVRAIRFDLALARHELSLAAHPIAPTILAYDQSVGTTRAAALQVQSELHAVGIPVELRGYSPEVFLGSYTDGGIEQSGKFDMFLARLIWGPDPDNSGEFVCAASPPGGYNLMRYCNPVMDRWQRIAIGTTDRASRVRAYRHIESLVATDLPIVPIWWPRGVHAIDEDLIGFAPSSLVTTWNVWQWRLGSRQATPMVR